MVYYLNGIFFKGLKCRYCTGMVSLINQVFTNQIADTILSGHRYFLRPVPHIQIPTGLLKYYINYLQFKVPVKHLRRGLYIE